ncbi:MAG: hypothetical protein ACKO2Z_05020, partial [Sphaerospermopsis kisseleviana]
TPLLDLPRRLPRLLKMLTTVLPARLLDGKFMIRSQESGVIYFGFWMQEFWIVFVNSNLKSKI